MVALGLVAFAVTRMKPCHLSGSRRYRRLPGLRIGSRHLKAIIREKQGADECR